MSKGNFLSEPTRHVEFDAQVVQHREGSGRAARADAFESYDTDLGWIIERLVDRTGGSFGVVCRFLGAEPQGVVLASGQTIPSRDETFLAHLTQAVRGALTCDPRATTGELITEWVWPPKDSGFSAYRALSLSFWPSPHLNVVAVVFREGLDTAFGKMDRAAAQLLQPVLARYVQLWWLHRQERNRANAYQTALDIADLGVILLNRELQLSFCNTMANSILAQNSGLIRQGQQLDAEQNDDGLRLQAALEQAKQFNTGRRPKGHVQRAAILELKRRDHQRPLIVTVLGLERPAIDMRDPAVIVYAIDPSRDLKELFTPLCNVYKFTNA